MPVPAPIPETSTAPPSRARVWSARLGAAIEVMFFIEVGMVLLILPWTPIWTRNSIVGGHALLQAVVYSGFCRGLVSGLGLLNLGYGVRAAFGYSDPG